MSDPSWGDDNLFSLDPGKWLNAKGEYFPSFEAASEKNLNGLHGDR